MTVEGNPPGNIPRPASAITLRLNLRCPFFALTIAAALAMAGCHHSDSAKGSAGKSGATKDPGPPPPPILTGALVPAKPRKPFIGPLEIGVFAREASEVLHVEKLSIAVLKDDKLYAKYRTAVRDIYGADMPDMNYFSIGHENWQRRIPELHHWLLRAGQYGAPTLALEPDGKDNAFKAFVDSESLRKLRDVFLDLKAKNITVWIRFASEANLYGNPYSVSKSTENMDRYKAAARWWKGYMPDNAKLVFSPLINTPYQASVEQSQHPQDILKEMYEKGVYGRIGGTIYSTKYNAFDMYDWYVKFMRELDPDIPLQICELGGPLTHKQELVAFIKAAAQGRWKGLEKINLFAGQVNSRAQGDFGRFGFVTPGKSVSYIREIFFSDSPASSH